MTMEAVEPVIRRGTEGDMRACLEVMWSSVTDLALRNGTPLEGTAEDWWAGGELPRFVAEHAAEWWVAEDPSTAELIGYARSIEREGLLELTEFFVVPGRQSAGVGRALLERAFPPGRGDVRSIIATTDVRAQARYYAAGTAARFPMLALVGAPAAASMAGDLGARRMEPGSDDVVAAVRAIELATLEHPRGRSEIDWLLRLREGHLYLRDGEAVGFAFVGKGGTGPIAALEPLDLPDILLHVEDRAVALGLERIEFQVPGPNAVAARHLLGRGFRIDPWINLLMSNREFGRFDRVLPFGPPLFL